MTVRTESREFRGQVHRVGDDVDTDQIIAARHLVTTDRVELASSLLEGTYPDLRAALAPGDLLVAGRNFGCGSSREHAPLAILGAGIPCVVAVSFARIFFRNAINVGLLPLECPEAARALEEGTRVSIDPAAGRIVVEDTGVAFSARPLPEFVQGILDAGGLVSWVRREYDFGGGA